MSSSKTVTVYNRVGWLGLVGVIFVLAKVFSISPVADWSWWLVLLPFYAGLAIILCILIGGAVIAGAVFAIAAILDAYDRQKRRKRRAKMDAEREAERVARLQAQIK